MRNSILLILIISAMILGLNFCGVAQPESDANISPELAKSITDEVVSRYSGNLDLLNSTETAEAVVDEVLAEKGLTRVDWDIYLNNNPNAQTYHADQVMAVSFGSFDEPEPVGETESDEPESTEPAADDAEAIE